MISQLRVVPTTLCPFRCFSRVLTPASNSDAATAAATAAARCSPETVGFRGRALGPLPSSWSGVHLCRCFAVVPGCPFSMSQSRLVTEDGSLQQDNQGAGSHRIGQITGFRGGEEEEKGVRRDRRVREERCETAHAAAKPKRSLFATAVGFELDFLFSRSKQSKFATRIINTITIRRRRRN